MRFCGTQRVLRTGRVTACSFGRSRARASHGMVASSLLRMADFGGGWANTAPRAGKGGSTDLSQAPTAWGSRGGLLVNGVKAVGRESPCSKQESFPLLREPHPPDGDEG